MSVISRSCGLWVLVSRRNNPHRLRGLAANHLVLLRSSGSFARVWLARLKGEERRDKIYALKILRKADGKETVQQALFYWIKLTERVATLQSSN